MSLDTAPRCTCHMDGSYILNCPLHGVRETLIHDAEEIILNMNVMELRGFIKKHRALDERERRHVSGKDSGGPV